MSTHGFSQEWDDTYRDGAHNSIWPWSDVVSYVMRYARPKKGQITRVLELGCGAGANIPFFLSFGSEMQYFGIDGSHHVIERLKEKYPQVELEYYQNNIEGELINEIQEKGFLYDGIILNAGGYTHTSVAIADAVKAVKAPVVEVHISNIFAREDYRHVSYLGKSCVGSISGFGLKSYDLAIEYFLKK